ncbi:nucleic acid-binding protein [Dendrothele bispora CBS 962.96]|uniref:Nucleic acid-binding protein n=1 Tax=Dendrothele bispora (strain CBS 962.96) TaxID=1314807 RepID=A0A4S8MSI5_DENBC|nr:nucleic acid-binding protein [Dendrothele bispora CBS 962.96]
MSFQNSVSKLGSPVKELVQSVAQTENSLTGKTEKDQAEVVQWIDKVAQGDLVKAENIKTLNATLVPKTYIATNYLTAADVALYGALHPVISKLQAPEHYSHPSVTRYFDHIQSCPPVRKGADATSSFPVVAFDFAGAPKIEHPAEAPKKKEKAPKDTDASTSNPQKTVEKSQDTGAPKKEKKEKKEKNKDKETVGAEASKKDSGKKDAGKKGGNKPAPEDEGEPVPSMIDLRVGHIIDVQKHPDADSLYIEQIDLGEETGPRTVVSGLVHYIPIEQMRDKYLVAVCNLKPANMRGVKSFAMVLCATSKDGREGGIELIQPPANSKPGDRVYFEGAEFENATPLSQLNPKKKIFETIQPGFTTLESLEAAWVNPVTKSVHKIRTKEGVCLAPTLVGASLS